jgi:hypothetical protein
LNLTICIFTVIIKKTISVLRVGLLKKFVVLFLFVVIAFSSGIGFAASKTSASNVESTKQEKINQESTEEGAPLNLDAEQKSSDIKYVFNGEFFAYRNLDNACMCVDIQKIYRCFSGQAFVRKT